ncbi:MAG: N-acetylmuramic acid 6-phosphate etherase [Epulopiscium sp.]|nr:N-acetylmuramic acid 6-phosphate etherase [Candidatus Epulonipiscium sp.]
MITESNNKDTTDIDSVTTLEMVKLMNMQDHLVAEAVEKELPYIAEAIDYISEGFQKGGRLLYFGAGTSGRLGVLDASECMPTFGVNEEMVQGYIAGGDYALRNAIEGAEDDYQSGADMVEELNINEKDIVVGITASGNTPYVLGAIEKANNIGCTTIGVTNNPDTKLHDACRVTIAPLVGPEVIQGSTRMKAGTSQKLVLNMLTTGSMIKIGKVYKNYMVDMKATNNKLFDRAIRLVMETTKVSYDKALEVLKECDFHVKLAIVMIQKECNIEEAKELLDSANGYIAHALDL